MPVLPGKDFRAYAPVFPDAYKTIQAGIDYLTKEKGVKRIYLMGYSMGARMTSAFLADQPHPTVVGFIGVGVLGGAASLWTPTRASGESVSRSLMCTRTVHRLI